MKSEKTTRIEYTSKNFVFSLGSTVLSSLLGIVSRTIFIRFIGIHYLGANSLFTNVISMLSLAELGISSAINFSLYKPIAEQNTELIKSLMDFYKRAYRYIALFITVIGLCLVPFLDYLIKDSGNIEHVAFIYLVFLYNTVVSYLFSYKTTLMAADQKGYMLTKLNMIINVLTLALQIFIMFVAKNYYIYLVFGAVISTLQWFVIDRYICNVYPFLREKEAMRLPGSERQSLVSNVKALICHKVGDLCINQTDNIIISAFISIAAVGLYDNYNMIIRIINRVTSSVFNAATASIGNVIATESDEYKYTVFKRYNFLGFWIFGWTGICLGVLLTPFVRIWLGEDYLIDNITLILVMVNYYLVGMRITIGNVKIAAGIYKQDQWAPLAQSLINLVVSIWGVKELGLAGVFLGTVISSIAIPCWYRPMVVYRYAFHRSCKEYFVIYAKYAAVVLLNLFLTIGISKVLLLKMGGSMWSDFLIKGGVCAIVPNLIIILLFRKTEEFNYIVSLLKRFLRR